MASSKHPLLGSVEEVPLWMSWLYACKSLQVRAAVSLVLPSGSDVNAVTLVLISSNLFLSVQFGLDITLRLVCRVESVDGVEGIVLWRWFFLWWLFLVASTVLFVASLLCTIRKTTTHPWWYG